MSCDNRKSEILLFRDSCPIWNGKRVLQLRNWKIKFVGQKARGTKRDNKISYGKRRCFFSQFQFQFQFEKDKYPCFVFVSVERFFPLYCFRFSQRGKTTRPYEYSLSTYVFIIYWFEQGLKRENNCRNGKGITI